MGFSLAAYDPTQPLVIYPVLVYKIDIGGSNGSVGWAIATDSDSNSYVTGWTDSPDFPVLGAIQPNYGGNIDAYVFKLNATGGSILYSTFLGGNGLERGTGIAVDAQDNIYVTGYTGSNNFPIAHALQPTNHGGVDAFVTRLNASGTQLIYSTYLGGQGNEYDASLYFGGGGIAIDGRAMLTSAA